MTSILYTNIFGNISWDTKISERLILPVPYPLGPMCSNSSSKFFLVPNRRDHTEVYSRCARNTRRGIQRTELHWHSTMRSRYRLPIAFSVKSRIYDIYAQFLDKSFSRCFSLEREYTFTLRDSPISCAPNRLIHPASMTHLHDSSPQAIGADPRFLVQRPRLPHTVVCRYHSSAVLVKICLEFHVLIPVRQPVFNAVFNTLDLSDY